MNHNPLGWTPHDGETVHLNPRNRWSLPAGRYRLSRIGDSWLLEGIANDGRAITTLALLVAAEVAAALTAIGAGELAREEEQVRLRLHAPLQQRRAGRWQRQHDASERALFRAANEPGLGL